MKKKCNFNFVYLLAGSILCILINSMGLNFLTPGEKVRDIVFENEKNVKDNIETLIRERKTIREMVKTAVAEYYPTYNPEEKIPFLYNNKQIFIERNIINGMRSYLLRTGIPDEGVLIPLERMEPKRFNFNPSYFAYGGFYIYSEGLYLAILKFIGILNIKKDIGYYLLNPSEIGKIFIALRIVNILLSLGSFFLIFLIGYRLQGQLHGIISSLLFIFTPGIVIWNHFARPHVFSLFWILLAVYFLLKTLQNKNWKNKDFVLGCIFTGLTVSILIPYGILISLLIPLTIILYKSKNNLSFTKNFLLSMLIITGVFLITNPYFLSSINEVVAEYKFTRMDVQYRPSLYNYYYYLTTVLKMHLGTPLWILFLICMAISLWKLKKEELLVISPVVIGFILFGTSYPNYLLRFIFFLPFITLIIGGSLAKIFRIKKVVPFSISIFAFCFLYTILYTLAHLQLFTTDNPRYIAGEWINKNIPEGTSIGLKEPPVAFRTTPFSFAKYKVTIIENKKEFEKNIPVYFVTSSFDWRFSRYGEIENYLSDNYEKLKIFVKSPSILNIEFINNYEPIPPDYCYFNPIVIIWKANK
ncbi:MAG: glycosyltransferase family 39 protein [bacterium]|nr:glycosyltransferase family 39 protein [bacterium]